MDKADLAQITPKDESDLEKSIPTAQVHSTTSLAETRRPFLGRAYRCVLSRGNTRYGACADELSRFVNRRRRKGASRMPITSRK
jgi:hypothetical protein